MRKLCLVLSNRYVGEKRYYNLHSFLPLPVSLYTNMQSKKGPSSVAVRQLEGPTSITSVNQPRNLIGNPMPLPRKNVCRLVSDATQPKDSSNSKYISTMNEAQTAQKPRRDKQLCDLPISNLILYELNYALTRHMGHCLLQKKNLAAPGPYGPSFPSPSWHQ
jgi:hypothetical protein